jgi:hypothetical protein
MHTVRGLYLYCAGMPAAAPVTACAGVPYSRPAGRRITGPAPRGCCGPTARWAWYGKAGTLSPGGQPSLLHGAGEWAS